MLDIRSKVKKNLSGFKAWQCEPLALARKNKLLFHLSFMHKVKCDFQGSPDILIEELIKIKAVVKKSKKRSRLS